MCPCETISLKWKYLEGRKKVIFLHEVYNQGHNGLLLQHLQTPRRGRGCCPVNT